VSEDVDLFSSKMEDILKQALTHDFKHKLIIPKGNTMEIRKGRTQVKVKITGQGWIWIDLEQVANDYRRYVLEIIEQAPIEGPKNLVSFEDYVKGSR